MKQKKPPAKRATKLTAKTADKHDLYQQAVQSPEAEVTFVDRTFKKLRGRVATVIREDFCGTAFSSCEWVRRRKENVAIGVDLHKPTLAWGRKHNLSTLDEEARARVRLVAEDVRTPSGESLGVDAVLAMNFSYWVFKTRDGLRAYFQSVRESMAKDGVFFLDHYGGYESMKEQEERRKQKGYTYVWDQASYNPITGDKVCHIHFEFPDGSVMKRAFTYHWRLWTLPEVQELLTEAGFSRVQVYWEGNDNNGSGNGVFKPSKIGEADASYISYIVAEK